MANVIIHTDQDIVKRWLESARRANLNDKAYPYTQFALLWFALLALCSDEIKNQKSGDDERVSEIKVILGAIRKFKTETFNATVSCSGFEYFTSNEEVINMRSNNESYGYDGKNGKFPSIRTGNAISKTLGLTNILYTIRCNLFHGYKSVLNDKDIEIVKAAVDCLMTLISVQISR